MDKLKTFGERIRKIRTERGLSQEQLAHLAGLHRTYIGAIERGERNVSFKNIEKIAKTLKVDLEELFRNM